MAKKRSIPSGDTFSAAAEAAQRAMPGWHAISSAQDSPPPPAVGSAMPGRTISQLKAKFIGNKVRSAVLDAAASSGNSQPGHLVKMVRNTDGSGAREMVVLVSGEKVVALQG